jgi:hypothetical protein
MALAKKILRYLQGRKNTLSAGALAVVNRHICLTTSTAR